MITLTRSLTGVTLLFLCQGQATAADSTPAMPAQDCLKVVCSTPSTNALGSMPLGNGDISIKVLPNELRPCTVTVQDNGIYEFRETTKPSNF